MKPPSRPYAWTVRRSQGLDWQIHGEPSLQPVRPGAPPPEGPRLATVHAVEDAPLPAEALAMLMAAAPTLRHALETAEAALREAADIRSLPQWQRTRFLREAEAARSALTRLNPTRQSTGDGGVITVDATTYVGD